MIKNVIFDLGKVLINYDFSILNKKFSLDFNVSDFDFLFKYSDMLGAGKISKYQFADFIINRFQLTLEFKEFEEIWCSLFYPIKEMEEFVLEVNNKYPVYIFSNTDEMHFPFLLEHYSFLKNFDKGLMLSYEIKALKPNRIAYERALGLFNLIPQECLFIDDKEENILAAREYGMQGIVHKDLVSTRSKMQELGLLV